jgi:hypothetical protein
VGGGEALLTASGDNQNRTLEARHENGLPCREQMKRISDHMYRMAGQEIPSSYGIAGSNYLILFQRLSILYLLHKKRLSGFFKIPIGVQFSSCLGFN